MSGLGVGSAADQRGADGAAGPRLVAKSARSLRRGRHPGCRSPAAAALSRRAGARAVHCAARPDNRDRRRLHADRAEQRRDTGDDGAGRAADGSVFRDALAAGALSRDPSLNQPPPPALPELPIEQPIAKPAQRRNAFQVQVIGNDVNVYNFAMAHLRTLAGIAPRRRSRSTRRARATCLSPIWRYQAARRGAHGARLGR